MNSMPTNKEKKSSTLIPNDYSTAAFLSPSVPVFKFFIVLTALSRVSYKICNYYINNEIKKKTLKLNFLFFLYFE